MNAKSPPRGWRRALPYALLLAATLGIYLQTLAFGFVWDDGQYVIDNFSIQSLSRENLTRLWTRPYLSNFAPLHLQLLALIHAFWGLDPFGYHLVQLLLHGLCVCLLYRVIERLESPRVALLASLWFAVHASNVETVAWISETKSTLALAAFLISFLLFIRFRERGRPADVARSAGWLLVSLLAKVSTVVAPAVFLAYDLREQREFRRQSLRALAPALVIAAGCTLAHLSSSQEMQSNAVARLRDAALVAGAPAAAETGRYFGGLATHILNMPGLLLHYVAATLVPQDLTPWHMLRIETGFTGRVALQWLAALALLAGVAVLPPRARFWGLWFLLFLAPVLQLVPNAAWVAERYLYIPAVGIFVLVSSLFCRAWDSLRGGAARGLAGAAAALGLCALGWQSLVYTRHWSDDVALWRAALPHCETSAFCQYKLGDAEMEAGTGTPVARLERAVALRPEPSYQFALARAFTDVAGDYVRARQIYQQAQQGGAPLPLHAIIGIARNHYLLGDYARARNAIAAGLGVNPAFSGLILVRAFVEWREGDAAAARLSLRRALELNRSNPESRHAPRFLLEFWRRPAEVGGLLRAVGPL